jgi:hypothetical protein
MKNLGRSLQGLWLLFAETRYDLYALWPPSWTSTSPSQGSDRDHNGSLVLAHPEMLDAFALLCMVHLMKLCIRDHEPPLLPVHIPPAGVLSFASGVSSSPAFLPDASR